MLANPEIIELCLDTGIQGTMLANPEIIELRHDEPRVHCTKTFHFLS